MTTAIVPRNEDGEDDAARLASRLNQAEARLEDAFDQAAAAGVRPGILRGYRRERDRARDESFEEPRAALRLYAMMTSDVRHLADDADASDGDYER